MNRYLLVIFCASLGGCSLLGMGTDPSPSNGVAVVERSEDYRKIAERIRALEERARAGEDVSEEAADLASRLEGKADAEEVKALAGRIEALGGAVAGLPFPWAKVAGTAVMLGALGLMLIKGKSKPI